MSSPLGRNALQKLLNFRVRGWFKTEIPRFAEEVVSLFKARNEILSGGVIEEGASISASTLNVTSNPAVAIELMLNGRLMADIAALSDTDLVAAAKDAIYSDGADAAAISLGADETAYVTLIATNSDKLGAADEDDGGTPELVAVIAGTSTTYADADEHLSSQAIQDALDASDTVHDGVTGWAHVAQILWADVGGAAWSATIVMNRNNAVSEA
jgi:hypothetical protein